MPGDGFFRGAAAAGMALALLLFPAAARALETTTGDIYFRLAAGAAHPFAANLSRELSLQGASGPSTGYTAGVSLGRLLDDRRWSAELWFDVARTPYFDYRNEYEDFVGYISDYSFMLAGKRNLIPESENSAAHVGAGLGYGRATVTGGAGKVDGIRAMALLQYETRLRGNISLLVEGSYHSALFEKRYDSPFLEAAEDDGIIGSDGTPLGDRYASLSLRLGIVVRLAPPSPYYR